MSDLSLLHSTKSKKNILAIFIFILSATTGNNILQAEDQEVLKPYLRKSTTWECHTINRIVQVNIYYVTRSSHSRPWNIGSPVLVYVKNHGHERIGTEADSSILLDYINEHYIVITIDFENDPMAVSPHFDGDLHRLFGSIYERGEGSLLKGVNLTPRVYRCFFVPAGCRVATDLVFWEMDKHGANGTLDFIMERYNKKIAGVVYGKEEVASPDEMTDRQGRPFQYKLAMDIVYPSMAMKKVPVIVYASTQVTRHPNVAPRTYRPHMMGFIMRGYAYAIIDHCYDPIRRHFWFNPGDYSLNPWNGLASNTAAIRFIRANAGKFNIDERYIGAMGHSKGEYTVARLSDPDHINQEEQRRYEGFPDGSPEPQPNLEYSSQISVGYQSPGNWPQYVSENDVPTIVTHGAKDRFGKKYKDTFMQLEKLDVNHVSMLMNDLGHELPYGTDDELGFDRYRLVHDFFDRYLKVEEKLPPSLLLISLPAGEIKVSPSASIILHFAPEMDAGSITDGKGVKVIRLSNKRSLQGNWKISRQGTQYTFVPSRKFEAGERYEIFISTDVKNKAGTRLDEEIISEFEIIGN